jgi:hypothetical protein
MPPVWREPLDFDTIWHPFLKRLENLHEELSFADFLRHGAPETR